MDLPVEVLEIIKNDAEHLDKVQLDILSRLDPFDVPMGEDLEVLTVDGIPPEYDDIQNPPEIDSSTLQSDEKSDDHNKQLDKQPIVNVSHKDNSSPPALDTDSQQRETSFTQPHTKQTVNPPLVSGKAGQDESPLQNVDDVESSEDEIDEEGEPMVLRSGKKVSFK